LDRLRVDGKGTLEISVVRRGQEKGVGWPEEHEENVQYRSDSVHTRWAREYPVWASCRF